MAAKQEPAVGSETSPVFPTGVSRKLDTSLEDTFCLFSARDGRLLSGHDSKIKVWDPNNGWSLSQSISVQGDVTCISQSPVSDCCVAVSVGNIVQLHDLRSGSNPVNEFHIHSEDINEINFHPKGAYLAACDDTGDIKVIDITKGQLYGTLTKQHENICSTVKFHPRKPWELISGGLDCKVIRWDFNRGRPLSVTLTQDAIEKVADIESISYLINPPMVHSLDFINGRFPAVACGLGNGSVAVYGFEKDKRELKLMCVSDWKHSASIAHICCTGEVGKFSNLVFSGGNDCKICISKFEEVQDPEATQLKCSYKLQLLKMISHGSKINWISFTIESDDSIRIHVADQTHFISVYRIAQP